MQSFYPVEVDSAWRESTRMVRHTIKHYSEKWFQYPWPHISAVEGPISGMEYPMVAMENKSADKYDL